jgi:hypothetical protein
MRCSYCREPVTLSADESWIFHSCGHLVARLETQSCYVAVGSLKDTDAVDDD